MGKYILKATSTPNIWWTKNSVDKPNTAYLNQYVFEGGSDAPQWILLGEITPNFLNQFNGQITVDKDNYNYFELTDTSNNSKKYFFADSLNKILSNGFVINITLDIFVTYTLYFLNTYVFVNPILINRTTFSYLHCLNTKALISADPAINTSNWPLINVQLVRDIDVTSTLLDCNNLTGTVKVAVSKLTNQNTEFIWWIESGNAARIRNFTGVGSPASGVFCDIYLTDDGYYFLVPLLDTRESSNARARIVESDIPMFGVGANVRNDEAALKQIRTNGFWISKYKGRFFVPMFLELAQYSTRWHFFENAINSEVTYAFTLEFERATTKISIPFNKNIPTPYFRTTAGNPMNFTTWIYPNSNETPNIYIKSKTCQLNDDTPLFNLSTTSKYNTFLPFSFKYTSDIYIFNFIIDTVKGVEWYYNKLQYDLGWNVSGFSTVPITTSNYLSYLATVSSSRDASLSAAKQNMMLGLISNSWSLGSNFGNLIGTGVGANGVFNAGMGIVGGILQYRNFEKQRQAELDDRQRTATPNQFLPNNYKDNYANISGMDTINNSNGYYWWNFDSVIVKTIYYDNSKRNHVTAGQNLIQYYNNLIWRIGYYINDYINLSQFKTKHNLSSQFNFDTDPNNPFIYWDIEVQSQLVYLYYPYHNKELQEAILITMNQPMRIWKTTPNYQVGIEYKTKVIE